MVCDKCKGSGKCLVCDGRGSVSPADDDPWYGIKKSVACFVCCGSGKCPKCKSEEKNGWFVGFEF